MASYYPESVCPHKAEAGTAGWSLVTSEQAVELQGWLGLMVGGGVWELDTAHSMCKIVRIHHPLSAKKEQW